MDSEQVSKQPLGIGQNDPGNILRSRSILAEARAGSDDSNAPTLIKIGGILTIVFVI